MPTYFNLHSTDQDRLMADNMRGMLPSVREYRECPITTEHMDGDRRLSDLCVEVIDSVRNWYLVRIRAKVGWMPNARLVLRSPVL